MQCKRHGRPGLLLVLTLAALLQVPDVTAQGEVSCPAQSTAPITSTDLSACKCNEGYSGPDGGPCSACPMDTYKTGSGDSRCLSCPAHSAASIASTGPSACKCNVGYSGVLGICQPCAEHSFTDKVGQSTCTQCAWGYHYPSTGGSSCLECFASPPADEETCPEGQELLLSLQSIESYFNRTHGKYLVAIDNTLMHVFCAQGFACLPCRPGQYELSGRCESCDMGKYQPHFEASTCLACSTGQVTQRVGATSSVECICSPD